MKEPWYKNAIIYGLDVKTFQDSNGDGIGDFRGLMSRLPYLKKLGITCLWLLPFYPSQNRDNGYDVDDYYNIDPRLGTLDDFRDVVREAKRLGMRVIIDLVVQHTSDRHPWFRSAVSDENSPYRNYYIWARRPTVRVRARNAFTGEEKRYVWHYSPEAKLWYHHWFYHFQPDLDVAYKPVQEEIFKIARFWMSFGISGFRVDAAGLLFARYGIPGYETKKPATFLKKLRQVVVAIRGEAILVGEADVRMQRLHYYIGHGDKLHMLFNFILNQNVMLALVRQDVVPILSTLKKLPRAPEKFVWVNFIRNLDEINLEKLGKDAMKEVRDKLGITPGMWIYNRGIRRRLAPMFHNDLPRLKMIWGLAFSLPGSPFIPYGEEIGIGDDLSLPFRLSVRIPMQWDGSKNGGFSGTSRGKLFLPVVRKGAFAYTRVNVATAERDPESLLAFMKKLIRLRKKYSEIGSGTWQVVDANSRKIMAFLYAYKKKTIITMVNLSDQEVSVIMPNIKAYTPVFKVNAQKTGERTLFGPYGQIWLKK